MAREDLIPPPGVHPYVFHTERCRAMLEDAGVPRGKGWKDFPAAEPEPKATEPEAKPAAPTAQPSPRPLGLKPAAKPLRKAKPRTR